MRLARHQIHAHDQGTRELGTEVEGPLTCTAAGIENACRPSDRRQVVGADRLTQRAVLQIETIDLLRVPREDVSVLPRSPASPAAFGVFHHPLDASSYLHLG